MGKAIIIELINKPNGVPIMKCPFCGKEMKTIIQPGYAPANVPDRILYDHPITVKCEWDGHTNTKETWLERKAKS